MKKGMIFDVDGTLWDACQAIADAWNEYIMKNHPWIGPVVTREGIRAACGLTMDQFADRIFPELDRKTREEVTQCCYRYETGYMMEHPGKFYPDERVTMEKLRKMGYHLYIVSNCQKGYVSAFLAGSGLGSLIEDYEEYGNTGLDKAANLKLVCERNHLDRAFYVGDTITDYQSTMQAGLVFIYASYGFGDVDRDVPRIDTFAQLPQVMEQLQAQTERNQPFPDERN